MIYVAFYFLLLLSPDLMRGANYSGITSEELTINTAYILCQEGYDAIAADKIKTITDFSILYTTKVMATQQTILHLIAINNCSETLSAFPKALVFPYEFINAQDIYGKTALMYAVEKKHSIASLLIYRPYIEL